MSGFHDRDGFRQRIAYEIDPDHVTGASALNGGRFPSSISTLSGRFAAIVQQ